MLEWHLATILVASHDHTCYPEEDDIRTSYEVGSRVVVVDLLIVRMLDTIKQRDRPQP
ncbi:Uncharacterised protein [Segatella copri]|nr:Uncharacterised protein [Segatella copri]